MTMRVGRNFRYYFLLRLLWVFVLFAWFFSIGYSRTAFVALSFLGVSLFLFYILKETDNANIRQSGFKSYKQRKHIEGAHTQKDHLLANYNSTSIRDKPSTETKAIQPKDPVSYAGYCLSCGAGFVKIESFCKSCGSNIT